MQQPSLIGIKLGSAALESALEPATTKRQSTKIMIKRDRNVELQYRMPPLQHPKHPQKVII